VLKRPRKATRPFFPETVVNNLQQRLDLFEQIFSQEINDATEVFRHKFVILCETFLQMYNTIFDKLQDYILYGRVWTQKAQVVHFVHEEERDFDVS
jgi:hypothetical protein